MFNIPSFFGFRAAGPLPFEFSVKTDNAGVSTSTQFRMPLTTSTGLNMRVDWGDGNVEIITNHTLAIHTYASAGTYIISVTGSILGWQFNNGGDRLKMLNVSQWAGLNISVGQGFYGCTNLTATAIDAPLITSTSFREYFRGCSNFNGSIGSWDVSNTLTMQDMFNTATVFNQNIGAWNVSNVTTFGNMFFNATAFNNGGSDDIDNWVFSTTSNINMSGFFSGSTTGASCKFNRYIGSWDTLRVTNMSSMFLFNTAFNQNIGNWKTSNVTNMGAMFRSTPFNQDISTKVVNLGLPNEYIAWDVSNVTIMSLAFDGGIFQSTTAFNQDIGNWDTSSVITMGGENHGMFFSAAAFNQNINTKTVTVGASTYTAWDTSSVTSMREMFRSNNIFNQPIGNWDTSNVTSMIRMFNNANAFNQDIGSWDVSNVTLISEFMGGKTNLNYSAANLSSIYDQWSLLPVQPNLSISFGTIDYFIASEPNKLILTNAPNLWTIIDGNPI